MSVSGYISIAVIGASIGLTWWRRKTLSRAVSGLPQEDRNLVADHPWYTPPPIDRCNDTLTVYRKLYNITRLPHYLLWALFITFNIAFVIWKTNS
ncbi:hypothetical protein [Halocynthiibacter styelae]|uniref:Uncharacterized protein n=1 Tax=Halocynthiibacter styelae TaxID=2761955 RepID=A0A8J7IPF8_9RHOB|nr:hypothetical protein [Paenihalocynthiibacter styelae]MBI1494671.1 hypothetical protein [Paenihalocynthiibacter styelae]